MKGLAYVPFGKLRAGMAESKKRGGGPKTPEGKARSSQNSTTHGMRAKHVRVLADERPEEYKRHFEGWMDQLEPQNFLEEQLARQVISNSWLMERATRRALENEGAVAGDEDTQHAADWSAAQEHKLELMQRYKTSAERAFYRSLEAYRRNRNDDMKDKLAVIKLTRENEELRAREKAREESRECQPQASAKPKKKEKLAVIEQWADISTNAAGKTVTKLVPSNEELQKAASKMGRTPDLVYRRLFFAGAVPEEYRWTTSDPQMLAYGGLGAQRMTWAAWKQQIVQEMVLMGGHLQPCANMPRPHERGGCECKVCTENQWMLAEAGLE